MNTIKQYFDYILDNYSNGHKMAERSDPIYPLLCSELPFLLKTNVFQHKNNFICTGSCGVGQKTDFPWVAVFNSNITRTATKGVYIVYLFKKDLSGFYLTLIQGITYYQNTYKRDKYTCARKVAQYFKDEIADPYFSKDLIDLGGTKGTLGYGYQQTTILSKYYAKGNYTNSELEEDLKKMIKIYDEIEGVLAIYNYQYEKAVDIILADYEKPFTPAIEAIEEINKEITSPLDVNVVRTLQYVAPVSRPTRKYAKLRDCEVIKKTDYVQKAKTDAEIGELGEKLALEYEVDRLTSLGRPDLAAQVRRVSIKSDAFGYDIESFAMIGTEFKKIFIEVKTTINKLDVDFQVSKNEVETSNAKKELFCLFRIYDAKNVAPKFYQVFGKLDEHFVLNPITYMAHYK